MPDRTDYEAEIEALHDFFVEWYCGECDQEAFETVQRALGDSFERVAPDGSIDSREEILESVRGAYDAYEPGAFEIEIRDVVVVESMDDRALVRYEEWQSAPSGTNGRLSTVLFATADSGITWRYLQETWLEPPE